MPTWAIIVAVVWVFLVLLAWHMIRNADKYESIGRDAVARKRKGGKNGR